MPTNDTFIPLRKSITVPNVQPVEVVQYWAGAGNLPNKYAFNLELLPHTAPSGIHAQRFVSTEDALKAISVRLQTEKFRPQLRRGTVRLTLYEWTDPTTITPVPGAVVDIDAGFVKDLEETIFEFNEAIEENLAGNPIIGQEYFFTVSLVLGYTPEQPITIARNTDPMTDGMAYTYDGNTGAWLKIQPFTNLVFQTYKSVDSLAVEVVGPKGKSLSDVYDALTTGPNAVLPEYGAAEFLKPFAHDLSAVPPLKPHKQLYIDNAVPPASTGSAGTIAGTWSPASDLVITLDQAYDLVLIETTERVRVDWGNSAYDTLDCSADFRLLNEGGSIAINEVVDTLSLRLHALGDTPPEITITVWKIVPPMNEEVP